MKKYLSLLLVLSLLLLLVFTLAGCDNTVYHWEFAYGYEEIIQIKIIDILETDRKSGQMTYIDVQEIDLSLAEQVYNDIINCEFKNLKKGVSELYSECFFVVFENGEFYVVSSSGALHFKYEGDEAHIYGDSWDYSAEGFYILIEKYRNITKGDWSDHLAKM